jgi:subtilisin family serine protease/subtilisin-like proprotein convertase family protein
MKQRLFAILMMLALIVTPVSANQINDDSVTVADTERYSQITGSLPVSETGLYIIQLSDPAVPSYSGGLPGLEATNPSLTGERKLNTRSQTVQLYVEYLHQKQNDFIASMQQTLGRPIEVVFRYDGALNGVAVAISHQEALQISQLSNVKAVFADSERQLDTDIGPWFLGAPDIWAGNTNPGIGTRGEGIIVGVIDTGINYQHPSFAASDGEGYAHTNPYGAGVYHGWCATNPGFCNAKLIGAYGLNPLGGNPADDNGHGSHTASTAAGNLHEAEFTVGSETYVRTIAGIAPRANVVAYKVCTPSCPQSASIQAVNHAIMDDQVDVLNYSISGTDNPWNDPVDLAFLEAFNAGIFIAASAGNTGPGPSTVAKTGPWNASVAASTINRIFAYTLDVTAPTTPPELQGIAAVPGENTSIASNIVGEVRFNIANPRGCVAHPSNFFSGAMALIERGDCTFSTKVNHAVTAGATQVIVYNHVGGPPIVMGGLTGTPTAVMIDNIKGASLRDYVIANLDVNLRINAGTTILFNDDWKNVVAGFSARGPSQFEMLAPTFIAPGVNTLAAGASGASDYFFSQGTSMSSPHAAGAGALLIALNPTWSPAEVRSALAMTAMPELLKEDGVIPADPFDIGSGLLKLGAAGRIGLVMDETYDNFISANPAAGGDPKTLNLPAFVSHACAGSCTWTRTVKSVAPFDVTYNAFANGPAGMLFDVSPATFTIAPGALQTLTFVVDTRSLPEGDWVFADIRLVPEGETTSASSGALTANHASLSVSGSDSFTSTPAVAIPDNGYNGTLSSMACDTIDASSIPRNNVVTDISVELAAAHTWVGDLTVKMQSPTGTILALVERPQGDGSANAPGENGTSSPFGDSSNLSIAFPLSFNDTFSHDPEHMGLGISNTQNVCEHDGRCEFFPNPDQALLVGNSVENFASLSGEKASGDWKLCMGDSAGGDVGTFQEWTLTIAHTPASIAAVHMPVAVIPAVQPPTIDIDPAQVTSTQGPDQVVTEILTITNEGMLDLEWSIEEAPGLDMSAVVESLNLPVGSDRANQLDAPSAVSAPAWVLPSVGGQILSSWSEGFDDIDALPALGWALINNSEPVGTTGWFQGNPSVFSAHSGATNSYIAANFNNTSGLGTISNWLLIPEINLKNGDSFSFWTRTATGSIWPDRLEVRWSGNGGSTDVGTGALDVGDFDTLLLSVNPDLDAGGYPEVWTQYTVEISGLPEPANGRLGFRYFVTNAGPSGSNSNYIGIDTVEFTSISACDAPGDVSWLSVAPENGITAPETFVEVSVTFDATGLTDGIYTASLCVSSNDPHNPEVEVPVTLEVATVYGATLTPALDTKTGQPGETVAYTLNLTNSGNVPDMFELAFEDNGWEVHLPETSFMLAVGESTEVVVQVTIPAAALDGDADVVTMTATSTGDSDVFASATLTTVAVIEEFYIYMPMVFRN